MSITQQPPGRAGADRAPEPGWTVPGVGIPRQRASVENRTHAPGANGDRDDRGDRGDRGDAPGTVGEPPSAGAPSADPGLGPQLADLSDGGGQPGHPVVVAVAACLEAMDGIKATSAVGLSAKEIRLMLLAVVQLTAALFALKLRLLVAGDLLRVQDLTGATSLAAFLAHLTQVPRAEASAQVRLAKDLNRRWPLLGDALAQGRINPDQTKIAVTALRKLPKDLTTEQTTAAQQCLVQAAQTLTGRQLKAVGRHLWEVIDPDGADKRAGKDLEDEEERARARASFTSWRNGDGTTGFRGKLPDAQADMLLKALAALASPRRRNNPNIPTGQPDDIRHHPHSSSDRTGTTDDTDTGGSDTAGHDASGPPPEPPDPPDDSAPDEGPPGRTRPFDPDPDPDPDDADDTDPEERETGRPVPYPVRLGHALMDLVERLPADLLPTTGGVNATIVVTTTLENLQTGVGTATLDTGTEISPAQLRRLACEAGIIPAVLDGESQPLDLGREQRLYTRYQRTAMALRDQHCRAEGCDRPAAWCAAHHLLGWSQGGHTNLTDGALVCDYHHHLIHSTNWTHTLLSDGQIRLRRQ